MSYKAILNVQLEVHEVNNKGECTGNVVDKEELDDFGIKTSFLLDINGITKNDCLTKIKESIKKILNQ